MNPANFSTSKTPKKGLKSCEHETSSNESLDKKLDPLTRFITNSEAESTRQISQDLEPVNNSLTPNSTDLENQLKTQKRQSCYTNPKTRSAIRTTRRALKPDDDNDSLSGAGGGLISDDCCSEASTISTRKSSCSSSFFRVNGLHIACMADPPDYDFQPNLQKVSFLFCNLSRAS